MAAPPVEPVHEEEEEYESDEFEVNDEEGDEEGDAEFQDEEGDEDEVEEEGNTSQSLTSLLIAGDQVAEEDEDDGGYAPPGETDPADEPIDGFARELTPEGDTLTPEKGDAPAAPIPPVAAGMKRKTSGDEGEENDDDDEAETKKVKA
ncbi:hypothetical protein M0805_002431 [Coniferiporia weirii]|nr:hypothetical protein M0805_002431 [Coniferiporia weirii]